MKYVDDKGKEYEIAYSTKVQESLERTLRETHETRKRISKSLRWIKWLMVIGIILGTFLFFWLDSRDAVTHIGTRLFCG